MVHPLLLPNVLKNVLNIFPPKELEVFRLVSIDWNHAACTELQHKKLINITSLEGLNDYTSVYSKSVVNNIFPHTIYNIHFKISCIEDFSNIASFIKNFKNVVHDLTITLGPCFLEVAQLKLILESLPFLEILSLQFYYFNSKFFNFSEETIQLNPLPSLKVIKVEIESYETSGPGAAKLLNLIFNSAPNIVKICHPKFCIPPSKCRIPTNMNIFLSDLILDDCEDSSQIQSNLRRFAYPDFIMKLNEENIPILLGKKYPLRHLFADMWNPEDLDSRASNFSLKTLISQLSPTLEKLSLDFPWRTEVAVDFCFQLQMRKLRFLSLNGFQGSLIKLMTKLPCLQNLELSQVDLYEILPSADNFDLFHCVQKLRLDFCTSQTAGLISRLSRIFPKLRNLDVNHGTNEVARMIFQKMHSLTNLRLHGDGLTDEGICGIPQNVADEHKLILCPSAEGDTLRKYPFIGNMPQLQYLKLDAFKLTEASIKHGIVHCTSLHFVSMDTRAGKGDPLSTVTRTFKLAEYGTKQNGQGKEATLILKEETIDSDEDAEDFFRKYEKGFTTDLLFV